MQYFSKGCYKYKTIGATRMKFGIDIYKKKTYNKNRLLSWCLYDQIECNIMSANFVLQLKNILS